MAKFYQQCIDLASPRLSGALGLKNCTFLIKSFTVIACFLMSFGLIGQPVLDGVIGEDEYGDHSTGANSDGNWYMTWDENFLYVAVTGNQNEGAVIYLDVLNVQDPPNSGSDSDGSLNGTKYDNSILNPPFRADWVLFGKSDYRELRLADGEGNWTGTVFSDNSTEDGGTPNFSWASGDGVLEFRFDWNYLMGAAETPESFNWMGSRMFEGGTNGTYFISPSENGNSSTEGATNVQDISYYHHISNLDTDLPFANVQILPPAVPNLLAVSNVGNTGFQVNWEEVDIADSYTIELASDEDFTDILEEVTGITESFYQFSDLESDQTYYYRVKAVNEGGNSDFTAAASIVTTEPDLVAPEDLQITNLTATEVSLSWSDVLAADDYEAQLSTDADFEAENIIYDEDDLTQTSLTISDLNQATDYFFRVRAKDDVESSAYAEISFTTFLDGVVTEGEYGDHTEGNNKLENWFANYDDEYLYIANQGSNIQEAMIIYLSFDDPDPSSDDLAFGNTSGFSYEGNTAQLPVRKNAVIFVKDDYAEIRLSNGSGDWLYKWELAGESSGDNFEGALRGSSEANGGTTEVRIPWSSFNLGEAPGSLHWLAYKVYNNVGGGGMVFSGTYQTTPTQNETIVANEAEYDFDLEYYFEVSIAEEELPFSNIRLGDVPSIPENLGATALAETSFQATWDEVLGAIEYRIDLSLDEDFETFVLENQLSDDNFLDFSELDPQTEYFFRVRSSNSFGLSDVSASFSVTTLSPDADLSVPENFGINNLQATSFELSWDIVGNAQGYELEIATDIDFSPESLVEDFPLSIEGNENNSYTFDEAQQNRQYYARVRAQRTVGGEDDFSDYSEMDSALTPLDGIIQADEYGSHVNEENMLQIEDEPRYYMTWDENFLYFASANANEAEPLVLYLDINPGGNQSSDGNFNGFDSYDDNITNTPFRANAVFFVKNDYQEYRLADGSGGWTDNFVFRSEESNANIGVGDEILEIAIPWSELTGDGLPAAINFLAFKVFFNNDSEKGVYFPAPTQNPSPFIDQSGTYTVEAPFYFAVADTDSDFPFANVEQVSLDPPILLAESDLSTTSLRLNWQAVTGATEYRVDVAEDDAFNSILEDYEQLEVSNTQLEVSGLVPNESYYYRVKASSGSIESDFSSTGTFTMLDGTPNSLPANDITSSSFLARWEAVDQAAEYRLDVSEEEDFSTFVVENIAVSDLESEVLGLASGSEYFYRVRAQIGGYTSPNSEIISLSTLSIPSAPVATEASNISQTSFTANWQMSNGATSYEIDVAEDDDFTLFVTDFEARTTTELSIAVDGLDDESTYFYRIRALNDAGENSGNSNVISVETLEFLPDGPVLSDATEISATGFIVSWTEVDDASAYQVQVSTEENFATLIEDFNPAETEATSLAIVDLSPSSTYYIRVRAVFEPGQFSEFSNSISVETEAEIILDAPEIAAPSMVGVNSFRARWFSVEDAVNYELFVALDEDFTDLVNNFDGITLSDTSRLVDGLEQKTTYFYRVRAISEEGVEGDFSSIQSVTTNAVKPAVPAEINIVLVTESSLSISWSAVSTATAYRIELATDEDFENTVNATDSLYTDTDASFEDLSPNSSYFLRLFAINEDVASDPSATLSFMTAPPVPQNLTAVSIRAHSVMLSWDLVSEAESYQVQVIESANGAVLYVADEIVANEFLAQNLERGTAYEFRVASVGEATSSYSEALLLSTLDEDVPILQEAENLRGDGFDIQWSSVEDASGYELEIAIDEDFESLVTGYDPALFNVTQASISGLTPLTDYWVRVRATLEGDAFSPYSNSVAVSTLQAIPGLPQNLSLELVGETIVLTWDAADEEQEGFRVYRALDGSGDFNEVAETEAEISSFQENLDELAADQVAYRVSAFNSTGESELSEAISLVISSLQADLLKKSIQLYPNPARELLNLQMEHKHRGAIRILLSDLNGKSLMQSTWEKEHLFSQHSLVIEGLKPGVYLLQMEIDHHQLHFRVIKE